MSETAKMGWLQYVKILFKGKKAMNEAKLQYNLVREAQQKSSFKSVEFWVAVLSGLGAVAASLAGILPPELAAKIAVGSSVAYSLSRGMAKLGDPEGGIKPGLASTETWATIASTLGTVAAAVSGAVNPELAAALMSFSGAALGASRGLAKSGAQPEE